MSGTKLEFADGNPITIAFFCAFLSLWPPLVVLTLPAAIGTTCFLSALFAKKKNRNDLLPARYDG